MENPQMKSVDIGNESICFTVLLIIESRFINKRQ